LLTCVMQTNKQISLVFKSCKYSGRKSHISHGQVNRSAQIRISDSESINSNHASRLLIIRTSKIKAYIFFQHTKYKNELSGGHRYKSRKLELNPAVTLPVLRLAAASNVVCHWQLE
jgi:hypothetical protein